MVIPDCETSSKSGTEVHFSHILRTFCGSFASMLGGVGSCGGWCILGQSCIDVFGCLSSNSTFSTDEPYFVQPVLELWAVATLSLTTLILHCCQAFLLLCHIPGEFLHGRFLPSGSTPDGGRCQVVSKILIGCCSFLGLFICHLIPHYTAVVWTPGDGYLLPFVMEGSKEV